MWFVQTHGPMGRGRAPLKGGSKPPPPPPSGAQFSEAPKAWKKIVGQNQLAVPATIFDWPKVRKKPLPNVLKGGGVQEGKGWGCSRRGGTSEAAPDTVRQAVGGGCQSGWGRLRSVTNVIEAGTWSRGDSGWA